MKKSTLSSKLVGICAATTILLHSLPTAVEARKGFHEPLTNLDNFVVAHGWGPARWGKSYSIASRSSVAVLCFTVNSMLFFS